MMKSRTIVVLVAALFGVSVLAHAQDTPPSAEKPKSAAESAQDPKTETPDANSAGDSDRVKAGAERLDPAAIGGVAIDAKDEARIRGRYNPRQEELEPGKTTTEIWKHWKRWDLLAGDIWAVKFSSAAMLDTQDLSQDQTNEAQVGDLESYNTGELRAMRMGFVAGVGANPENRWAFTFFAAYRGFDRGYDRSDDPASWAVFDAWVSLPAGENGRFTVGKMKAFATHERLQPGLGGIFMERAAFNDAFFSSRDDGFAYQHTLFDQRMSVGIGVYNNFANESGDWSDNSTTFATRLTWLAYDGEGLNGPHLHVGGLWRYSDGRGSQGVPTNLQVEPEVGFSNPFIQTQPLSAQDVTWNGLEAYVQWGPTWMGAEVVAMTFNLQPSGSDDPVAWGGQIFFSVFLTGERRQYHKFKGWFRMVKPRSDVTEGGHGAVELAARWSYLDANSGAMQGGVLDRWTAALNWIPSLNYRLTLQYGYARLDRFHEVGYAHIVQARLTLFF